MIHLKRLPKPQILIKKEREWTDNFVNSGKDRPSSTQYGHKEIRNQLHTISYKKCFYSEVKFATDNEGQIDHYIEVSEDKSKAFDWDNLFLSHKDSNQGKPSNKVIPNNTTLNPFIHTDEDIEKHLTFEDECIRGKTSIGLNTVQKYKLENYNYIRLRELQKFSKYLDVIKSNMISEKRDLMNETELMALRLFAQPDYAFSLMFRIVLRKHSLL